MGSGRGSVFRERLGHPSVLPGILIASGSVLLFLAAIQISVIRTGGGLLELVLDFVLFGTPGIVLVYAGFWLPESEIQSRYYPRLITWLLGGVAVMYGFVALRDLHPGVTVEWSLGTQAIALAIGSIGGLLIGVHETQATMQTQQLERQTEQLKHYTLQLERREEELERQNEQLDQFASVVSHDLRNPLNVARGRLELLEEDCDSDHTEPIAESLTRMETLIEDLLTLAREGKPVSELEPVALGELSDECWGTVATETAELRLDVDRSVRADEDRLRQLFENLYRNAVEHGDEDVTVTVGQTAGGFYVEDDGPGIAADDRSDVFEMGYTTAADGTGFGLNIAKQVVEAHGWNIRVTEGTDGGARFEVTGVEFV